MLGDSADSGGSARGESSIRAGDFQAFNAPLCPVCCKKLSIHEQAIGKTCAEKRCKDRFLRDRLQQERDAYRQLEEAALQHLAQAVASESFATDSVCENDETRMPVGIMPSNDRKLLPMHEKRVRRFRDRLMRIISQAAVIVYGGEKSLCSESDPAAADESRSSYRAIVGGSCGTCRGQCCFQGTDHAFIQVRTIVDHMRRHPDQRPSDVLQTYMAHLGGKTYDQSCVFHGEGGCRLPREMRSHICNEYHCKGLNDLIYQLPDSASRRAFVVATSGQKIVRSAFIDQEPATEEPGQERFCGQRR